MTAFEWLITIIMTIGAVFIAIFAIPNLVKVLKTRNTAYINLPMYIIFTVACLLFAIYGLGMIIDKSGGVGILVSGISELVSNSLCVIIAIITLIIKGKNMHRASKLGMNELQYWQSHYGDKPTLVATEVK